MKNKIFELFVCMLLMGTCFIVAIDTVSAEQDGDYAYTTSGSPLVATITGYTGAGGAIMVPSTLGGYPTVSIGSSAFRYSTLTSVTIPDSVTTIEDFAFADCSALTSATIGNSVTTIGIDAFGYCSSLTSVTIPDSVTTIGNGVFEYCSSLTSVTIGNTVTIIGNSAFAGCSSLTSIIIGYSATIIGNYAFYVCTSLTSVTIPDTVTIIGNSAFAGCSSLTSVIIGNSTTTIENNAFYSCEYLTSITFLGLFAPTTVGTDWILDTPVEIRGHAYAASNFPPLGGVWNGLTMDTVLSGDGVGENEPPRAGFTWTPSNSSKNETITFDTSASDDPDGSLILYEWDWNNDGVYEESDTASTTTHSWAQAGNYPVTLRVTDDDGATSTKKITVTVSSGDQTPDTQTPGFEILFVIGAIAVSILLWKKKRKR